MSRAGSKQGAALVANIMSDDAAADLTATVDIKLNRQAYQASLIASVLKRTSVVEAARIGPIVNPMGQRTARLGVASRPRSGPPRLAGG
jgi:hypothetical protein